MGKKQVFVAGRYEPSFNLVLGAIRDAAFEASKALGVYVEVVRPDQLRVGTSLSRSIRAWIEQADIVIADVTGSSPSVLWEIGFAQASGKKVLLLSEDIGDVPFDLHDHRVILYQRTASLNSLVARLMDALVDILREPSLKTRKHPRKALPRRRKVFISYSYADGAFLHRILIHLRPLERKGLLDLWSDTKIKAGDRWREEIRQALKDARLAVLLISADFLASDFIETHELPPLLVAAEEKGARIIPIIVKPSRFVRDDRLSRFQALYDPKQPLIHMDEGEREDIYAKLAETIEVELNTGSSSMAS